MTELAVQNITCGHCVSTITRAIKALDAQAEVQVDIRSGRVRVEGALPAGALIKALDQAGYAAPARRSCCCG